MITKKDGVNMDYMEQRESRDELGCEALPAEETADAVAEAEDETEVEPEAAEQPIEVEEKPKKQGLLADLYDWIEVFAVSVAAVFVIFAFVARVAVVDGESMTNTLQHQDQLIVQELFYTPKQGDIVVCQSTFFGFDKPLVKRIIATEGQTISIDTETWTVTVDGVPLKEDYVRYIQGKNMHGWSYGESYTVPEGHVFVMGDNRNGSWDSRDSRIGPIDERYIVGKVIFRFAPLGSFGPVS